MCHLVLGDFLLGFEDEEEKYIFSINEGNQIPYYKDRRQAQRVSFEINLNQKTIKRQIYTWLDCLGDIGGLNDALTFGLAVVLFTFNPENFEKFLVRKLYK